MAINEHDLAVLIYLIANGHLKKKASVIEMGAQQCSNALLRDKVRLKILADLLGIKQFFPLRQIPVENVDANGQEFLSAQAPAAAIFWRWLEFKYKAVDLDESFDSVFIDLNFDEVSNEDKGKYHLVTNYGTTEHLANQLNAFKVIHELAAVGGVMIHSVPSQGMETHGLINYNPKFFWMLARSNGYEWLFSNIVNSPFEHTLHQDVVNEIAKFSPNIKERSERCPLRDSMLFVVLKKISDQPYVPPLDVNTGTKTSNDILKQRYWSVFT